MAYSPVTNDINANNVIRFSPIADRRQWGRWVVDLVRWEERHREYLNQKTVPDDDPKRAWFTHKMVRKSFVHIRRALPDLFHYLDNPDIPNRPMHWSLSSGI